MRVNDDVMHLQKTTAWMLKSVCPLKAMVAKVVPKLVELKKKYLVVQSHVDFNLAS